MPSDLEEEIDWAARGREMIDRTSKALATGAMPDFNGLFAPYGTIKDVWFGGHSSFGLQPSIVDQLTVAIARHGGEFRMLSSEELSALTIPTLNVPHYYVRTTNGETKLVRLICSSSPVVYVN